MNDGVARTFEDGAFSNLRTLSRPRSHRFCGSFICIKVSLTILILYWLQRGLRMFKSGISFHTRNNMSICILWYSDEMNATGDASEGPIQEV